MLVNGSVLQANAYYDENQQIHAVAGNSTHARMKRFDYSIIDLRDGKIEVHLKSSRG